MWLFDVKKQTFANMRHISVCLFACAFIHSIIIDVLTRLCNTLTRVTADCHRINSVQRIVQLFNHCNCLSFENCLTKPTLDSIQVKSIMAILLNLQKAAEFSKMKHVGTVKRSRVFGHWVCDHRFLYLAIPSSCD